MACLATAQVNAADEPRKLEGPMDAFLGKPCMEVQPLFKAIRHPNIVVTLKGTVLATLGDKKLLARRSEDGGKTWGEEICPTGGYGWAVWLGKPSGYGTRLVTLALWLHEPSGYRTRLVTPAA